MMANVAIRERNWQIIEWVLRKDPYHYGVIEALEYALAASDYQFAARLTAVGIKVREKPNEIWRKNILHENFLRIFAKELGGRHT